MGITLAFRLTVKTRTTIRVGGTPKVITVKKGSSLGMPEVRTQATNPWTPRQTACFLLTVSMTAVKPLLASITLVVLWVILALPRFTVTLTRVDCRVGVLPILLLAIVIMVLAVPQVLIRCSPRLGDTWVNISCDWHPMTRRSRVLERRFRALFATI